MCTVFPGTKGSLKFFFENASIRLLDVRPYSLWDDHARLFMPDDQDDFTGVLIFEALERGTNYGRRELSPQCMIVCGLTRLQTAKGENRLKEWAALYAMGETIPEGSPFDLMNRLRDRGDEIILHELRKFALNKGRDDALVGENGEPTVVEVDLGFQRFFEFSLKPRKKSAKLQRDADRDVSAFEFNVNRTGRPPPKRNGFQRLFRIKQPLIITPGEPQSESVWWGKA